MDKRINTNNIFYWLQFIVVALAIIYSFTFVTFHVHQSGFNAKILNFKLPFINGLFFYTSLFFGVVCSIINQILHKQFYKTTWLDGLIIAYILFCAISLFWARDVGLGLAALTTSISFYTLYYLANDLFKLDGDRSFRWMKYLIYGLTVSFILHFFISNINVLLQFIHTDYSYQKIITQSKSWVGGKNQTACFLALLLPIILLINNGRWYEFLLLILIVAQVLLMGSRNAYIAIVLFGIIYLILNKIKLKQFVKIGVLLFFIFLIFFAFVGLDVFINQLKNNTWASRFTFWQQTLEMATDYWLLGIGAGQWDAYRLQYDVWYSYKHPHNDFIRNFAELGLAGTLLFYSIIANVLILIYRKYKEHKKLAIIAFGCLLVYLSLSFFDELKMKDNYNILLALMFVLIHYKLKAIAKVQSKYFTFGLMSFVLLCSLYLVIYPIQLQSEMLHYKAHRQFVKEKKTELAVQELKKINQSFVNSINRSPIDILIANTYFNKRDIDKATSYYAKAAEKNQHYINEIADNLNLNITRNKKHAAWRQLTKMYLLDPCNSILENESLEIHTIKKSKYYQNIIQKQKDKCTKP